MKPILFSTEMVKAIIDGKKIQTRRVVKPQPNETDPRCMNRYTWVYKYVSYALMTDDDVKHVCAENAPIQAGDILWVRETFAKYEGASGSGFIYKADDIHHPTLDGCIPDRWLPTIHMPRAAARIFLKVTGVRCERLNDISVEDCIKEGMTKDIGRKLNMSMSADFECKGIDAKAIFAALWDSINSKRGYPWESNPWVWCYSFERCEKPGNEV